MMKRNVFFGLGLVVAASLTSACSSADRQGYDTSNTPGGGEPTKAGAEDGDGDTLTPTPGKTGCAQDAYTEALPTKASLSGLTFSKAAANDYLLSALELRYPLGKEIVEGGLASSLAKTQGNCIDRFLHDTSSAKTVLQQASTVVHECGHFFDLGEATGNESAFVLRPKELSFTCKEGDTTTRNGRTFARSLIKSDAYYANRKACPKGTASQGCDMYAGIYLDGDPTDATFDSGDQGYNSVLEEATQYINSLATALAFEDQFGGQKVSERDGILTFLWYIERYLAMARAEYPDAYAHISEDPCWRQATLSVWDRAWFFLRATDGLSSLGIDDAALDTLVNEPKLVAEIDALRQLECK